MYVLFCVCVHDGVWLSWGDPVWLTGFKIQLLSQAVSIISTTTNCFQCQQYKLHVLDLKINFLLFMGKKPSASYSVEWPISSFWKGITQRKKGAGEVTGLYTFRWRGLEGGCCDHILRQSSSIIYSVQKVCSLPVMGLVVGHRMGKRVAAATFPDCGLLSWFGFAVDGNRTLAVFQQTKELISTWKLSHKHNKKDLSCVW